MAGTAFTLAAMRAFRLLVGGGIEPELRSPAAVSALASLAFSAFWTFVGVFGLRGLGASSGELGIALAVDACAAAVAGYTGGALSDRVGRRPLIVASWVAEAVVVVALALVGRHVVAGLALIVAAGAVSGPGIAALNALVADLLPPERCEAGYASMRVVFNLAVVAGPSLAGLTVALGGWRTLFFAVAALAATAAYAAVRWLPSPPPLLQSGRESSLRAIACDRRFLVFLGSSVLSWIVYVGYESALPIAAVVSYGLSTAAWGALMAINPALVTLFQLRLTSRLARVPARVKLPAGVLVMGGSLLALTLDMSAAMLAAVVVVFVFGEMLWAPTASAAAAALAPDERRGAYMGAFGSTTAIGFAVGPLVALQLRGAAGDGAMWMFFGAASLAASAAAVVSLGSRPETAASQALRIYNRPA
jgi:MFS family permease